MKLYQEEVDKLSNRYQLSLVMISKGYVPDHLVARCTTPARWVRVGQPRTLRAAWLLCRAKFGETAFLDVYQKLYEAPDPTPALCVALVSPAGGLPSRQGSQCLLTGSIIYLSHLQIMSLGEHTGSCWHYKGKMLVAQHEIPGIKQRSGNWHS